MAHVRRMAAALAMARDLINTPAADLTPERLADEALALAARNGGDAARVVTGDALREGYPGDPRGGAGRGVGAAPGRLQLGRSPRRRR